MMAHTRVWLEVNAFPVHEKKSTYVLRQLMQQALWLQQGTQRGAVEQAALAEKKAGLKMSMIVVRTMLSTKQQLEQKPSDDVKYGVSGELSCRP